jgi:hypothetical protein
VSDRDSVSIFVKLRDSTSGDRGAIRFSAVDTTAPFDFDDSNATAGGKLVVRFSQWRAFPEPDPWWSTPTFMLVCLLAIVLVLTLAHRWWQREDATRALAEEGEVIG